MTPLVLQTLSLLNNATRGLTRLSMKLLLSGEKIPTGLLVPRPTYFRLLG